MFHLRTHEVQQLLHNKFVVVMGDSVQRAVYKDLVLLLQKDCLLSPRQLKAKGELSFEQDVLLEGGRRGRMHNGTHYREVRQFCSGHHLVRFYFLTRVYSQYVVEVLEELQRGAHDPDLVIMNSCLWDLPRYGRDFRRGYCENLKSLFGLLDQVLSVSCLLVWNTAMPVAEVVSGGFLPAEYEHQSAHLREDVIEANFYSAAEASKHGFDVLDLHFHFRHAGQHRQRDGVHWDERAHRHISQLLLAHVADAWGVDLPCRYPVGRWLRGDAARGSRVRARGRQHGDRRGDPGEQASSSRRHRSTRFCSPQQSSAPYPRAPPPFPIHDQGSCVPAQPPVQHRPMSTDPAAPRGSHPGETNFRSGRERRLGPIRRASSYHQSREFPPYQPCSPSRPRRHRRRHADPQSPERRGFRSQSRT